MHNFSFSSIRRTVQYGSAEPFFPGYDVDMPLITNKLNHKLRKAPQAPLSYPGAMPDSDRAKKPALVGPPATDQELAPGDRVERRGDFGKLTGEFGTVEKTNEEDALIKWDGDGRKRIHQPSLKKISQGRKSPS
jgi:hypothetical protein